MMNTATFVKRFLYTLLIIVFFWGCSKKDQPDNPGVDPIDPQPPTPTEETLTETPATWDGTKRGDITYQLLIYSFVDSNGDKVGDINGIISKLDYLQSLGIKAIWLSPIHPSMSYHGYDVLDYKGINPSFGTLSDFNNLITQAHNKDIKIYLDFVINHTGSKHPWFLDAKSSLQSPYRDYYIFSQNPAADITQGKIPMIAREGSGGYDANQWFTAGNASSASSRYKFVIDFSNSDAPTVTVNETEEPAYPDNTVVGSNDKYLYFGDAKTKKFYDRGNGKFELVLDFKSDWGFLIRTSTTIWAAGTKYGANSSTNPIKLGTPFRIYVNTSSYDPSNIEFGAVWKFHSHFWTDWFADLNYGSASTAEISKAFIEITDAAKVWIDRGVDGFRLDAVKHIYHSETSDENPIFLKKFYDNLNAYWKSKGKASNIYMIGEMLSDYNAAAPYYSGLPALFNFSFWWTLEGNINNQNGNTFAQSVLSYRTRFNQVRSDYIEGGKLSNHDEDRTGAKFGGNIEKCKLAGAVLLTSGGHPYIYYGEELGYQGVKQIGDEYVRAPMNWGDGNRADYTSKIDNAMLNAAGSVVSQSISDNSILKTYMKFTKLVNTYDALAKGTMQKHPQFNENNSTYPQLACWYMVNGSQKILVMHNFGSKTLTIPMTDTVNKLIMVTGSGTKAVKKDNKITVTLGAYSSILFEL